MLWATKLPSRLLLIPALLAALCSGVTASEVTLPDWARQVASQPQKNYPERTNAVVLFQERNITVVRSGEYTEHVRRVVRILRAEGRNEATLDLVTSGESKVESAHGWCASPDGHSYEAKQQELVKRSRHGERFWVDDDISSSFTVPSGNAGAVVALEYTIKERTFGDYAVWDFQEDIPVELSRLTLSLPPEWNYRANWVNWPAVKAVDSGSSEWSWEVRDVTRIDLEEKYRLSSRAMAGALQLAFSPPRVAEPVFANWSSIGKWSAELSEPRRQPTPEMVAKVQELTAGAGTFEDKVARIADFMQRQIRYIAIELGIGGWQPHPAGDVFHHRYGDCKDKATLMGTMLQSAGIHSRNVAIFASRGVTHPEAPGNRFNHEVLAIELPEGAGAGYHAVIRSMSGERYLIFDPTNEFVPVGEMPYYEQGNYALLTSMEGGELVKLPLQDPSLNRLSRVGKLVVSTDGAVSGKLDVELTGSHAWGSRERLLTETELQRTKSAENFLSSHLQTVALKELTFGSLTEVSRPMVEHYSFNAPNFLKQAGPLLVFQPCVFGHKGIRLDWKKRKYPVELSYTTDEVDSYEIVLPAGLVVDELSDPVEIDVGFASYKSSITADDGVVRYRREYIVRQPEVPLEKLDQLRKLEDAILRDESSSVVLKKKR